ncbi:MAG TPA: 2-hydroxychromene-2-carboxylate isomerase [Spongiibacteraceae bacterium]|nr:2-hydroxychromene-2-carboxylate isomerase [Spongiibacteraceae bacterium]
MLNADWYFDFISPYSYFAWLRLDSLPAVQLNYRPLLFAGLLNHWEQKGPAEIAGKREWTYRWCTWWARQQNIAFRFPAAHPFNPIPYLRLALAANCSRAAIDAIFKALWTTGADAGDPQLPIELARSLNIDSSRINEQSIKDMLRQNTDEAVGHGVFGVPTLRLRGQLFWGADALDFARDFLSDPTLFDDAEMHRVSTLPIGVARKLN